MKRLLGALIVCAAAFATAESADAQVYQVYYPAPVTTYYAPTPVAVAPAPTIAYYPTTAYPTTAYYPTAVATTRYRPLIGGTVTRWRYVNRPTTYVYPSTVAYYPAW